MPRPSPRHRITWRPPQFSVPQILAWADDWYERTGTWPQMYDGRIPGTGGENWRKVDNALRLGLRGLPGQSSLAQLLDEQRDVRNPKGLPPLTRENILAWADRHYQSTGSWPKLNSGPIADAPGETWSAVHAALSNGKRGWPGGYSLARFLADERGVPHPLDRPPLTIKQILTWADAHHKRMGWWPTTTSGPIIGPKASGETWAGVDRALRLGKRGLPGNSSLRWLLMERRGVFSSGRARWRATPPLFSFF